jgi:hypothetical protein
MNATQDFTAFAVGTEVLVEGCVAACPICGRNAIEHRPEGRTPYWVHRQTMETLCDGMLVEFDDVCTTTEEPGSTH